MKNLDFQDSILRLPEGMTFPVEFGEDLAGILIKRALYEKLKQIISFYKNSGERYLGVIFIGPPGAGKVCAIINYFILSYTNLFVK
jgi:DNA replication protein DnaC